MNVTRKFIVTAATVVVLGFGAGAGLAACSSGGGQANAQQVLASNGYTYDAALTQQVEQGDGAIPAGDSLAAGEMGSNVEIVIVATSPALASTAEAGVNSEVNGAPGITVTQSGDVVTASGPLTAWGDVGNSNP